MSKVHTLVHILCLREKRQIGEKEWAEIMHLVRNEPRQSDARIETLSTETILMLLRLFLQSRLSANEIVGLALCVCVSSPY